MSTYATNCIIIITSTIIECILIRLYLIKKILPTKNNILFQKMVTIIFLETLSNLVTIMVGSLPPSSYTITLHFIANVIYCILYEVLFLYIPEYILWNTAKRKQLYKSRFKKLPTVIVILVTIIVVINNNNIFYVDALNQFHFGAKHYILNVFPLCITILSLGIFLQERYKNMTSRDKGIVYGTMILLVGVFSNNIIKDIFLMDFFLCFYLIILYITAENPIFFTSERIGCYNLYAFESLVNELIFEEKNFYVYGIDIRNFHSIRSRRGTKTLYLALSEFTLWIESLFPDSYIFYTDNMCLNILSFTELDENKYNQFVHNSMNKKLALKIGGVHLWTRHIKVDCNNTLCKSAAYILNGEAAAIQNSTQKTPVVHVDEAIFQKVAKEQELNRIIEKAIRNDNIHLYIQPLYGMRSRKIEGGEILARIIDDEYGVVMPGDFIPLAEKSGVIIKLSNIIFEKTCRYIANSDLKAAGIQFISVNCSPVQFEDLDLADKLKDIADTYDVDFSIFKFEVTESYMSNGEIMKIHINAFKEYGAAIAMDDFGKGCSNLSRLTNYDFDIAKLDLSLVWDYFDNKNTIMKDVINIFKSENLKIVAEGVETAKMAQKLIEMECDFLQGYYFAKPVPIEDFLDVIKDINASDLISSSKA